MLRRACFVGLQIRPIVECAVAAKAAAQAQRFRRRLSNRHYRSTLPLTTQAGRLKKRSTKNFWSAWGTAWKILRVIKLWLEVLKPRTDFQGERVFLGGR